MIKITRDTQTAGELCDLSRRTKDLAHATRLRGVAVVLEEFRRSWRRLSAGCRWGPSWSGTR